MEDSNLQAIIIYRKPLHVDHIQSYCAESLGEICLEWLYEVAV